MSGWLDGWRQVNNPRSGGGTYDPENEGYPWRIVLHTIEGRGFPNTAAHQYPPQLWYNPGTREKIQTIPLDRSGYALYQGSSAPYYTNRARAIQVELVGFAEEAGSWPDSHLVNIAQDVVVPVVRWVQSVGGKIDLSDPAVPLPGAIPNSAREDAPQRLDPHVWAFGPIGLCSHRHVPMGDDHWDAGELNARRIAAYARDLLGGLNPASEEEDLTPQQAQQLADLHATMVGPKSLTPTIQQTYNQTAWTWGLLQSTDKVCRDTFNQTAWTWELLQNTDKVCRDTFNATAAVLNEVSGDDVGGLATAVAAAVSAKLAESGGLDPTSLELEMVRQAVRDVLVGLSLKPAA